MIDVNDELAALTAAAEAARGAEEEARGAARDARRLVADKRAELSRAYAAGDSSLVKAAGGALERAERVAAGSALAARVEGTREAVRVAELAIRIFTNEHYVELIEALRPRAEVVVNEIRQRAVELVNAVTEWYAINQAVCKLTRDLQWWNPRERMPGDPFDGILGVLDAFRLRELPVPMPLSMESPAEAEQARAEQQAERDADRAAPVDPAASWAA